MTLIEFNNLPFEEKYNFITSDLEVKLISFREYHNHKVTLWDCGTFFAESYYLPAKKQIAKIEGFKQDDKRLDIYIDYMNKLKSFVD